LQESQRKALRPREKPGTALTAKASARETPTARSQKMGSGRGVNGLSSTAMEIAAAKVKTARGTRA